MNQRVYIYLSPLVYETNRNSIPLSAASLYCATFSHIQPTMKTDWKTWFYHEPNGSECYTLRNDYSASNCEFPILSLLLSTSLRRSGFTKISLDSFLVSVSANLGFDITITHRGTRIFSRITTSSVFPSEIHSLWKKRTLLDANTRKNFIIFVSYFRTREMLKIIDGLLEKQPLRILFFLSLLSDRQKNLLSFLCFILNFYNKNCLVII